MLSKFYFGKIAEYFIIIIYACQFYKILAHRASNYGGEIDIIASKKNTLVFIEVKARKNFDHVHYNENILSNVQKSRIKRAAQIFISYNQKKYSRHNVRFDLVLVRPYRLPNIFKNAW